jgi:hypothetical protein
LGNAIDLRMVASVFNCKSRTTMSGAPHPRSARRVVDKILTDTSGMGRSYCLASSAVCIAAILPGSPRL